MNFRRITQMLMLILAMTFGMSTLAAHAAEEWNIPTSKPKKPFAQGSGTANNPYLISSAQELANLAYMVTEEDEYYKGKYFRQTRDIVLNDNLVQKQADGTIVAGEGTKTAKQWKPIGDCGNFYDDRFMGIYDGDGHSISGIYCIDMSGSNDNYVGLFAKTQEARISNLTIKDSYICPDNNKKTRSFIGALIGFIEKTCINNCHVENTTVQTTITPIAFMDWFDDARVHIGGLVGEINQVGLFSNPDYVFNNCSFDGYITMRSKSAKNIFALIGGLVGNITEENVYIQNCTSKGLIKGIEFSKNEGDRNTSSIVYTGMVGSYDSTGSLHMEKCCNMMTIQIPETPKTGSYLAGFAFISYARSNYFKQCANLGTFEYNSSKNKDDKFRLYGFYGNLTDSKIYGTDHIEDCVNYCKIKVDGFANAATNVYGFGYSYNNDISFQNIVCQIDLTWNGWKTEEDFTPFIWSKEKNDTKNCFYHATVNNEEYNGDLSKYTGVTKKSQEELKQTAIVNALNSSSNEPIWGFNHKTENYQGYPLPIACGGTLSDLPGNGTKEEPYLINNENDLRKLAEGINEGTTINNATTHYKLNANIYMSDDNTELPTIGTSEHPFLATFDGNGYQIAQLKKNSGALFGEMQGTVKNLALTHYSLSATSEGSAIAMNVGSTDGTKQGNIENCYVTGDINTNAASALL